MLLFVLLSPASPASALLPLAAVVRKAGGFYAMTERCGRFCGIFLVSKAPWFELGCSFSGFFASMSWKAYRHGFLAEGAKH